MSAPLIPIVPEGDMAGSSKAQEQGEPKGIIVDASNTNEEFPSAEKPQVPQEIKKKTRVMQFIAHAHDAIGVKMLKENYDRMNLSLGDQIHEVLFTSYTILRERLNQTGGTLEGRIAATDFKITFGNKEYTHARKDILDIVVANAALMGIPFAKYDQKDPLNWYEIANPLLNFLSGFALRRREIGLGYHTMSIEERNNVQTDVTLAQYGIYGVHHILCDGVTFPPERRDYMTQYVGPITALICYIKADKRYLKKWEDAVKRAFAQFPDIDIIMPLVRGKKPSEIRTLMSRIADVALIVTTGAATGMYPPPAAFSYIIRHDHQIGSTTYSAKNISENFDVSGHGAFLFYKMFSQYKWSLNLNGGNDSVAKQIVYHSMFGTYKEDLSILASITNQGRWDTRKQMGNVFTKSNTEGSPIEFLPIAQKYYSKLSQANQTGLLPRTKRKYGDAFFDNLMSEQMKKVGSMQSMISNYTTLRDELVQELRANKGMLNVGTTGWWEVKDITATLEPINEVDIKLVGSGRVFMGNY